MYCSIQNFGKEWSRVNYRFLVIYQKTSGEIIYRILRARPKYKKGDTTSMGWKVLDIKNMYKGNLYTNYEYRTHLSHEFRFRRVLTMNNFNMVSKIFQNLIIIYISLQFFVNFKNF